MGGDIEMKEKYLKHLRTQLQYTYCTFENAFDEFYLQFLI